MDKVTEKSTETTMDLCKYPSIPSDPGTTLALSFFYGYLKIVLPSTGNIDESGRCILCFAYSIVIIFM